MKSDAATVKDYIAQIPGERRVSIEKLRVLIIENLPKGYEETMNWGMITYQVPLSIYGDTYKKKPLMYAAIASQKNYMSLYLTAAYMNEQVRKDFEKEYRATGKKPNMGKSCLRFRKLEDLPLELIRKTIASLSVDDFVSQTKRLRAKAK